MGVEDARRKDWDTRVPVSNQHFLHETAKQAVLNYLSHRSRLGGVLLRTLVVKCLPRNHGLLLNTIERLAQEGLIVLEPIEGEVRVRLARRPEGGAQ